MNEEHIASSTTPHDELMAELMDSRIPKTEREHVAANEIARLRADVEEWRVKQTTWQLEADMWKGKYRAIVARVEDVEGVAKIICHDVCQSIENADDLWESVPDSVKGGWRGTARAMAKYAIGEG